MVNLKSTVITIGVICMMIAFFTACGDSEEPTDQTTEPSTTITQDSSSITEDEQKQIVDDLLEELYKLEDGDKASTAQLMKKAGYDPFAYYPLDMVDVHSQFAQAAKENGITLDMSAYDGLAVGLPQNLEFIVRK